ncbi:MAG: hypothetical protein ACJAUY_002701 [Cognaticolwellia sp.]|jgi:hypothetical protein
MTARYISTDPPQQNITLTMPKNKELKHESPTLLKYLSLKTIGIYPFGQPIYLVG